MREAYLQAIHAFAEAATNYCRLIERCREVEFDELIIELDLLLPGLYIAGHHLVGEAPEDMFILQDEPGAEEIEFDALIRDEPHPDPYADAYLERLRDLFGDDDQHYLGVNYTHPSKPDGPKDRELPDTDVHFHSSSEELIAMYSSIRSDLAYYRQNDFEDAGRGWISGFYGTWGEYIPHLLGETFWLAHGRMNDEEKGVEL